METKEEIDPFDIEALEKAVNNSAVRVSTIWVTYLIFGLYLAVAVGNVTQRQLFIAESIKLPVLNVPCSNLVCDTSCICSFATCFAGTYRVCVR